VRAKWLKSLTFVGTIIGNCYATNAGAARHSAVVSAYRRLISSIHFERDITMNLTHRKVRTAGLATLMVVPTLLLGVFGYAQDEKKVVLSGQKYKNIKVLKTLPADQLIPVMHKINDALGVKCDYCHVVNPDHTGFELDTKPEKAKAREMIIMTGDIMKHQKTLKGKGSCFMCHHGSTEPALEPMK